MRIDIDFIGEEASAVKAVDAIADRLAGRLTGAAKVATEQLEKLKIDQAQVSQTKVAADQIERVIDAISRAAEKAKLEIHEIGFEGGQVARIRLESKAIAEGIENIGEEATRSTRKIATMRAAGGGRGFFSGGYRKSIFGESLGAIVPGGGRAKGPALAAAVGLGAAAAAPLTPGALALLAAVPALATAGAGALVTLALSFGGVGKAIGGNRKEFEELLPVQKQFVLMMRKDMIPLLNGAKEVAAKGLFPGLTAGMKQIATSAPFMKSFGEALHKMGVELGGLAQRAGAFLTSAGFLKEFDKVARGGIPIIDTFASAAGELFDALFHLAGAFQPLVFWMAQVSDKLAGQFDAWVKSKEAAGGFNDAISAMERSLSLFGQLVGAVVDVFVQLVIALMPVGNQLLPLLISGLHGLADWLHANRKVIADITTNALGAFVDVLTVTYQLLSPIVRALKFLVVNTLGWRTAFQLLFGLFIVKNLLAIRDALFGVATAEAVATGTAGGKGAKGLLSALLSLKGLGRIAIEIVIVKTIVDKITGSNWFQDTTAADKQGTGGNPYPVGTPNHDLWALGKRGVKPTKQQGSVNDPAYIAGKQAGQADTRPRAHVSKSGPNKGKVVYVTAGGQEVEAKPGTKVGTPLPGSKNKSVAGASTKGGLQLPTSFKPTHDTMGIAGYQPSIDITTKIGQPILAPEDGQLYNRHLIPYKNLGTSKAVGGWTVYFNGMQTGNTYFITHMGSARPEGYYKRGEAIGTGGRAVNAQHVHLGIISGPGVTGGDSTITPRGTAAPWTGGTKSTKPALATKASITTAITAAKKDLAALKALQKELALLGKHVVTKTIEGVTLTATVGAALNAREAQLKKQIAIWQRDLLANEKYLRSHKNLTSKQVSQIRAENARIKAAISQGMTDLKAIAQQRADAFADAWDALTDRAMQQFDKARDAFFKAFDKETAEHKTPTEIIIEQLTSAHEEKALQDAVDEARKNLDDALKGLSEGSAQDTVDRISEIVGRYSVAMAVDKAQAAVLGGAAMDLGPQMLKELQDALSPTTGGPDPEAVKQARKDLEEALYNQDIYFKQKTADAERKLYDEQRQDYRDLLDGQYGDLRENLARQLGEWREFLKKAGAAAGDAAGLFAQVWRALTGQALPSASTSGPNTGFPGSTGPPAAPGSGPSGSSTAPPGQTAIGGTGTSIGGSTGVRTPPMPPIYGSNAGDDLPKPASTPNPGGAGAAAVAASGGTRQLSSVWDVNSPSTYDALNAAASAGGAFVITEDDPQGLTKAAGARERGVPYYVQVNYGGETPQQFADKVARAKAQYPDAAGFILDVEGGAAQGGAGSAGADWNTQAAPLVKSALGGTPFTVTNEPNKGGLFNYAAWTTAGGDVMVQAYGTNSDGSLFPWDVQDVVDNVVSSGVPRDKVVALIYPGQPLGRYTGRYSVYGVPKAGDIPPPSASAPATATTGSSTPSSPGALTPRAENILNGPTPTLQQLDAAADRLGIGGGGAPAITPITHGGKSGSIKMVAEGGILTRPTLMIGGEKGREAVIPLDDPRAQNLLGGDVQVHLNFAPGTEWLRNFVEVEVVRNARTLARVQGKDADTRQREGRV